MSKYSVSVTADGDTFVADVNKKRDFYEWFGTFIAYGTWGGGTITYKISPDGGTTKIPLKDASGSSITSNADDNFTINLAAGAKNSDAPKLYVTMAGSTNPAVTVVLYDNNG